MMSVSKKAPQKQLIVVTKDDIEKGKANDTRNCPIAIAMKRKFKHSVSWGYSQGYLLFNNKKIVACNRKKSTKFVESFDNREPVKPFKFYVEIANYD